MSVLFYSRSQKGAGERLHTIVKTFVPKKQIEIFRTIDSLSHKLREPKHDEDVAVLMATSRQELEELSGLNDLLGDLRVILILPNRQDHTIARAHALRPRFLTYTDSNFIDVAAVLSKMLAACR